MSIQFVVAVVFPDCFGRLGPFYGDACIYVNYPKLD